MNRPSPTENELRTAYQWALDRSEFLVVNACKFGETRFLDPDAAMRTVTLRARHRFKNGDMVVMFSAGGRRLIIISQFHDGLRTTSSFVLPKELWPHVREPHL